MALQRSLLVAFLLTLTGCTSAQMPTFLTGANSTPENAAAASLAPRPIKASKIVLVGDSTTAVGSGWGPSFCAYHVTSFVACINLARGGRSSGSYRAEGSWKIVLAELRTGAYEKTYVLIQFGHNDQPGKPGRSTDLATEFPANLRHYVEDARSAGAIPVLVTPLTRRQFKDGKLTNDLEPWAEAIRRIAKDMNVPLLDLNADSAAAVQSMGALEGTKLAQFPPSPEVMAAAATGTTIASSTGIVATSAGPSANVDNASVEPMGQPKLAFDYTHLGRAGADCFAAMVARELAAAVPDLRHNLLP